MKLKTLKDIRLKAYDENWGRGRFEAEVKAEAVKWVKYIDELGLDNMIWKEFFNITEEDLK